jgi:acyl-CoA dehydrogenase
MQSIYFTPEHTGFREALREFLLREVAPFAEDCETNRQLPRQLWQKLGHQGLLGLHYPKSLGGGEKDFFHSICFLEELGRLGYVGIRVAIGVHSYMATTYLYRSGSDSLKQQYLPSAIRGEKIFALAMTEPDAGSDLNRITTTATADGDDHFVVSGIKQYVANGTIADCVIVVVRTEPARQAPGRGATGLSLLLVDMHSEGVTTKAIDTLGMWSADTAEICFDQVRVPAANLIGKRNQGFFLIMQCLQLERLAAGTMALGGVEHCLELTWQFLSQREVGHQTLSRYQALRHRMADHITELNAARQLAYHAAWLYEKGALPIAECSMLKLKATELATQVAKDCMQFHGARGYNSNHAIARIYRDCQAASIAAGANEVMRDIIAQSALDEGLKKPC